MPPGSIGAVRHMLQNLNAGALEQRLVSIIDAPDHSLREALRQFAQVAEVPVQ
jgi:signal transduction protein with GAF and PtsI domain